MIKWQKRDLIKYKVNFNINESLENLHIKLDNLIEKEEYHLKEIDELSIILDRYDEKIYETKNKILELQKQNNFTYYCRYGRFPNDWTRKRKQ